jgi:hypothetical protein
MTAPRLLTLVVLGIAIASTFSEAKSIRIHVTAEVTQATSTGNPGNPQLGDQRITNVALFDESHTKIGTGAGVCTILSIPPLDTLEECLLTAEFTKGQIIFGGLAPLAEVGAVARFGILGGTDDFRKVRGDATLVVTTNGIIDVTFELDNRFCHDLAFIANLWDPNSPYPYYNLSTKSGN